MTRDADGTFKGTYSDLSACSGVWLKRWWRPSNSPTNLKHIYHGKRGIRETGRSYIYRGTEAVSTPTILSNPQHALVQRQLLYAVVLKTTNVAVRIRRDSCCLVTVSLSIKRRTSETYSGGSKTQEGY